MLAVGLLLALMMNSPSCLAQTDWSDNFNDGNNNGWTLLNGSFSASSQSLQAVGGSVSTNWNLITHDSDTTQGFWSFNLHGNTSAYRSTDFIEIMFLCDELTFPVDFLDAYPTVSVFAPLNGYSLFIIIQSIYQGTSIQLYKWTNGVGEWLITTPLERDIDTVGWKHYNITRDAIGNINVYTNDTLTLSATDTGYKVSTCFLMWSVPNHKIDDITVSGTTSTPPGVLGFPVLAIGLGLGVGLGVGISIRRRDKK
jgi:hypothetical protein